MVWLRGKGEGNQRYVDFTLQATRKWPSFAELLEKRSGVRLDYGKPGGLFICLGEAGFEQGRLKMKALADQSPTGYDCEMIDRLQLEKMIPRMKLGPKVSGASFCWHDGSVNPLYLIRGLHAAFQKAGGRYCPGTAVTDIHPREGGFQVEAGTRHFEASKLVLAAGVKTPDLAAKLGMRVPVRPRRGQLIVTERVSPVLPFSASGVRQTVEGTFIQGYSNEEAGFDPRVTPGVLKKIAGSALDAFPVLADVRMQRCWAALRPLTPDAYPVYEQCGCHPGAYVITFHSAVTLASQYADTIARWISDGTEPDGFDVFSLRRFHV